MPLFAQHGEVAFLIEEADNGFYLYTREPSADWDSWHLSLDDAMAQANRDLGRECGPWREVDGDFWNRPGTGI